MIEENAESSRIVQITLCTSEDVVATLVKDSSNPDFAETQIAQLDTIAVFAESATKFPDVFIVDISNDHDVESLFCCKRPKTIGSI